MEEQHSMIELQGIIKRFYIGQPNELEILHGIDLKVNRGEFVSIVGSSGSGKTTMMNIIGILDRPTEGEYILDGVDVAHAKDRDLSMIRNKKIGFVFQTYNLINGCRTHRMNCQEDRSSAWPLQELWLMSRLSFWLMSPPVHWIPRLAG